MASEDCFRVSSNQHASAGDSGRPAAPGARVEEADIEFVAGVDDEEQGGAGVDACASLVGVATV